MQKMEINRFIILVTLFNMIIYNIPLYNYSINHLDFSINGILTFLSVLILLFVVTFFIFSIIAFISIRLFKIFIIFIVIANSIAIYFINTYNVILDRSMMGNLFNTDKAEISSYLNIDIFLYLLILGVIPAIFISKIKIYKNSKKILISAILTLIAGIILMYLNSATWLWLDKNFKKLGALSMPWSYIINSIRYYSKKYKQNKKEILLPKGSIKNNKKIAIVLVIGESARAKNFSLYGYNKDTNPYLEKRDDLILLKAKSNATYTTASIHTLFSYKGSTSDSYEQLPNYLHRIGIKVIWKMNNHGGPILHIDKIEKSKDLKPLCKFKHCNKDEFLLTNIDKEIKNSDKIFIVLHTAGSHGPTYYKKYPKDFEIFKPVCKSVNLKKCSQNELINAYDNTILYTDYFLNKAIEILSKIKDREVVLIYISDHGESLGEYGLYLHGTPYSIAPNEQKEVPFIIWASKKLDINRTKWYNQKYLFHTILGLFCIDTPIYNKNFDIIKGEK